MIKPAKVKGVFFDADDTLWENHLLYLDLMKLFWEEISRQKAIPVSVLEKEFYDIQEYYLRNYGYGLVNFVPALITLWAGHLPDEPLSEEIIASVDSFRRKMLKEAPVLVPGARETLESLKKGGYDIFLLTKGNYYEQFLKISRSGLKDYFNEIFIVPEKNVSVYRGISRYLELPPEKCVMVGNSLKSDIYPALEAGWRAVFFEREENWIFESPSINGKEISVTKIDSLNRFLETFTG